MEKQQKAGFLLDYSINKQSHLFHVKAVNRPIRQEEMRFFIPSNKATAVLNGEPERQIGNVHFLCNQKNRNFQLVFFPFGPDNSPQIRRLGGEKLAAEIELLASRRLKEKVGGTILDLMPETTRGWRYLRKTGRGFIRRFIWGGFKQTMPLSISIGHLEKFIREKK
ncbi:MAG: hypothetical protein ABIG96_05235 [Candidatus Micrarchaeota archaeon]